MRKDFHVLFSIRHFTLFFPFESWNSFVWRPLWAFFERKSLDDCFALCFLSFAATPNQPTQTSLPNRNIKGKQFLFCFSLLLVFGLPRRTTSIQIVIYEMIYFIYFSPKNIFFLSIQCVALPPIWYKHTHKQSVPNLYRIKCFVEIVMRISIGVRAQ